MENFLIYHCISFLYCMVMSFRRYYKNSSNWSFGMTPGLDAVGYVFLAWVIAPVDLFLTLRRLYIESKTAR